MFGETVWILPQTVGSADVHGNVAVSWPAGPSAAGAVKVDGAAVGGRVRLDNEPDVAHRDAVIEPLNVFLPSGTTVRAVDRLWVRGEAYEVAGEPFDWVSPYSSRGRGVQVAVVKVAG